MKLSYFLPLLLIILNVHKVHSQQREARDSIVYLKEVVIPNTKTKPVLLKNRGGHNEFVGFYQNHLFVSLVKDIPQGQLNSITLFFNTAILKDRAEAELRLLVYDIDESGKPGNSLLNKDVRFKVRYKMKGKIVLDLKALNLDAKQELFFGFETVHIPDTVFIAEFRENPKAISFAKGENRDWFTPVRATPVELRTMLEVDPY